MDAQVCSGSSNYYYYIGTTLYSSKTISQCISASKKYLLNCECKDNCYEYYKRIIYQTTGSSQIYYAFCYDTLIDAFDDKNNVNYCDPYQKICWTNFPDDDDYYIKTPNNNYDPAKYEIIKICPNYYNEDGGRYWCKDDCKSGINKFFYRGNKECLSSCNKIYKYYYDPENMYL